MSSPHKPRAGWRESDSNSGASDVTAPMRGGQDVEAYAPVSAVGRAMDVLERLATTRVGIGVSDLSRELSIEKSIISRILASLVGRGYVEKDPTTDLFHLTFKLSALAQAHLGTLGFPERCFPILRQVANATGELVVLAAIEGERLWDIAKVESSQGVRVAPFGEASFPPHASAAGKVWLALLPESEALRIATASGLRRYTPHTITSTEQLVKELAVVREQGYATQIEELVLGTNGVAVAVRSPADPGTAVAALAVIGPTTRLSRDQMQQLAPRLEESARALTSVWPLSALTQV